MRKLSKRNNQLGATFVEYALMVCLIALILLTAVANIGTNLKLGFEASAGCLGGQGCGEQGSHK